MSLEVWQAKLPQVEREYSRFERVLSPDEAERAENMANEDVRTRFVIGRGLLRHLLAERLGALPGEIRFAYTDAGKPRLADSTQGKLTTRSVEFSLSHSGDLVVVAVSDGEDDSRDGARGSSRGVGVDVEQIRRSRNRDGLIRRFATLSEQQEYFGLASDRRLSAFYRWWTRKEALIKAAGMSLARGLGTVSIPFSEERHFEVDAGGRGRWLLASVLLDDGYWMTIARAAHPGVSSEAFLDCSKITDQTPHRNLPLSLIARW